LQERLTQFYDAFQHSVPLNQFLTSNKTRRIERIKAESPESERMRPFTPEQDAEEENGRDEEFPTPRTPRRQSQFVDLSSAEKTTSDATGNFKERIATYALDSPDHVQILDSTLTPLPEVTIHQSSPSKRVRPPERESEVSSEESDVEERPVRQTSRNSKRTIRTIVTPSQMEAMIGPSKRGRTDEAGTASAQTEQTSLWDRFLRKADNSEARGGRRDVEALGLLSPEQVSGVLATVDTNQRDLDEGTLVHNEEDIHSEINQDEEIMQEEEDVEKADDGINAGIDVAITQEVNLESHQKSDRNLFKSRQKNAVHDLRLPTAISLQTIQSQHEKLKQTHHSTSHYGKITATKEYTESNEKAEERLSLTVSKEDFGRMRIVGQFNLGFIIAVRERRDDEVEDVFIIDQHASDEKYNFERLQAETTMQVQTLAK